MNPIFLALFFTFTSPALALSSSETDLRALWARPSAKLLEAFKKSCSKPNNIDFDGRGGDLFASLQKKAHVLQIRALVYAEKNCSDGSGREAVLGALGNEILLQHPAKLIQALHEEKRTDLGKIVEQENNDWFAVECEDDTCRNNRKAYFAKKRKALESVKGKKAWGPIKSDLLSQLQSDK